MVTKWEPCCRGRKCCPLVRIEGDVVFIQDDYGSIVKVTMDQLSAIYETVEHTKLVNILKDDQCSSI